MTVATGPNHPDLRMFAPLDAAPGRRMSSQSIGIAIVLNLAIILLALRQLHHPLGLPRHIDPLISESLVIPPSLLHLKAEGGSGGNTGSTPVGLGNPPKYSPIQLAPLTAAPVIHPELAAEPSITVQTNLAMNPNLPNVGLLTGTMPTASPGNTRGNGVGPGTGDGAGPGHHTGSGGGDTGTLAGGPILAPQVLYAPEPEFSENARRNKVSGNVLVTLTIDAAGRPTDIRVLRGLGFGLDEKAIEAVSHYKFKPAMQNGRPVPVAMNVNVDFQIF